MNKFHSKHALCLGKKAEMLTAMKLHCAFIVSAVPQLVCDPELEACMALMLAIIQLENAIK